MEDVGLHNYARRSAVEAIPPLTLSERWGYLQGAALCFLLGTLALDTLILAIIVPEALFAFGWMYLAGAASDDRRTWGLFIGSIFVAVAAIVGLVAFIVATNTPWGFIAFFLGPYLPTVYAPIVTAHAVVFGYLAARLAVGGRGVPMIIGAGSIALVIVAVAGLLTWPSEDAVLPAFFMPLGYGLISLGTWQHAHRLRTRGSLGAGVTAGPGR